MSQNRERRKITIPRGHILLIQAAIQSMMIIILAAGCVPYTNTKAALETTAAPEPTELPATATAIPTQTPPALPISEPTPTQEPELALWTHPLAPPALVKMITLPAQVKRVDSRQQANLYLEPELQGSFGESGGISIVFALVAPFPTTVEGIKTDTLQHIWQGQPPAGFDSLQLLLSPDTLALFETFWGPANQDSVKVMGADQLLDSAWQTMTDWAIIPFEEIEPRWKVLRIDGVSPLESQFDASNYALTLSFQVNGIPAAVQRLKILSGGSLAWATNRDATKLTVLVMTGVTALVRNTSIVMEREGITYPGRDIRHWLLDADLTHISNEVSFADDCPPGRPDTRFCSPTRYIGLLDDIGTNIIELTGNHNLDWGAPAYLHTLELYQQRGWVVYGGGATPEQASQPALVEHNGNRLAFLGCNAAGPEGAWASQYQPGAAKCDIEQLERDIQNLHQQGYLPVVTLQHVETDNYRPEVAQRMPEFRRLARAGAVIVSGSQSHYPQTMTFVGNNFVHYGLGNLFFDQMGLMATRQEFIDRHVFYNGRYLGVELLTALLEDYARPRPMTEPERVDFLNLIFEQCVWKDN